MYGCIMRWAPYLQAAGKSDEHLNAHAMSCLYQYGDEQEEADNFGLVTKTDIDLLIESQVRYGNWIDDGVERNE